MHRSTWALAAVVMVALASFGLGKPVRDKPCPAITLANAALVVKIAELPRDVWEFAWVPGERSIAVLSWESSIDILDADTFKPIRTLGAGSRLVHFALRSDGEAVAWSENATKVQVNNLRTGKTVVVDTEVQQPGMALSPDGKVLATGGYGNEAKLWDPATGTIVRSLHAGVEGGLTVLFSPDGKQVAVGNRNDKTHLYETATGKRLHVLYKTSSQELKFSPDGKVLAIAYANGSIGLWDPADGKLLRERENVADEIYTLDWSPAGDVLATAGRNGKITLWNPRDLSVVKELEGPEWVIRIRFSPDGSRLVSAGGPVMRSPDRKLLIWGLPPGVER